MGQFAALETDGRLNGPIQAILARMLERELVSAVMVPATQPHQKMVMQTLFTDPARLEAIDPFAPIVPTISAKAVSALTCRPSGRRVAVALRSCEVRAFLELVKLHQGSTDDLVLIGIDCLGRLENRDYLALAARSDAPLAPRFLELAGGGDDQSLEGLEIVNACKCCTRPAAEGVDLRLCVIGADPARQIHLEWVSARGEEIFKALELEPAEAPAGRSAALEALVARRRAFREQHLASFVEQTADLDGLAAVVAPCINCYNCRVACPVCYCRECVFVTETMRHDAEEYLRSSAKWGALRMPADTLFYHLTRMIHMSTLCVGCGQCSSACPNGIPLMELFQTVADRTQARFDYVPGRSLEEPQPLAVFYPDEYDDVTGQYKEDQASE